MSSGGTEYIYGYSGTAIDTIVSSGGSEYINFGGTAIGTTVTSGGSEYVEVVIADGVYGTASGTTLNGGTEFVQGGTASGTTVNAGGSQYVDGGAASGPFWTPEGSVVSTTVNSGGSEYIGLGGTASGTTVNSGGTLVVSSGGSAIGTVLSGGIEYVHSGGTVSCTTVGSGGTLVDAGGTILGATDLQIGGTIDVAGLTYVAGGSASVDLATDVMTVTMGGQTITAQLSGNLVGEQVVLSSDTTGGTNITVAAPMGPTMNVLASFNRSNGANPYAGLVADANGNLFGTTVDGGANGDGTVFEIAKTATGYASAPTTLVSFNGANGANPYGRLIMDASGNLIGAAASGGANGGGAVFETHQDRHRLCQHPHNARRLRRQLRRLVSVRHPDRRCQRRPVWHNGVWWERPRHGV